MSVQGVPKFNEIVLGDISADFKKATISLSGVAAFVDSDTGMTHGWTKGDGPIWSKETMIKLQDLRKAMEQDLAKVHFSERSIQGKGEHAKPGLPFQPMGIGQHIGVDTPSV